VQSLAQRLPTVEMGTTHTETDRDNSRARLQIILEDLVVLLDNLEQPYTQAQLKRWAWEKYVREHHVELPDNYG